MVEIIFFFRNARNDLNFVEECFWAMTPTVGQKCCGRLISSFFVLWIAVGPPCTFDDMCTAQKFDTYMGFCIT
jgi:hypothetical protein